MTYLADVPRTNRQLFEATADMTPEDARALAAEKLRRDLEQINRIDRVLARGLIRPAPRPELRDWRWMLPTGIGLGIAAFLIGVAV